MNSLNLPAGKEKSLDACIVKTQSKKSYAKSGREISSGEICPRLHFNFFDKDDTRFDIPCFEDKPSENEAVRISVGKKKVYVTLEECSKRLHISEEKLLKSKKRLNKLFQEKLSDLKKLNKIIDHYEEVLKYHREGLLNTDNIFSRDSNDVPALNKRLLMKIIRLFHKKLPYYVLPAHFTFLVDEIKILAHASLDGTYYLINKTFKQELASGSHGEVYKVHNITLGTFSVLKQSLTHFDGHSEPEEELQFAFRQVEKEIDNLNYLKSLGISRCVQNPPYFSFKSKDQKKISFVGHFYKLQDLLIVAENVPKELRMGHFATQFSALIHTLEDLHAHNIVHTDIKTENIFVDKGFELLFGDVGGMQYTDNPKELLKVESHTPAYTPLNPMGKMFKLSVLKSMDVYQLGAAMIYVLTDKLPFESKDDKYDYPDFKLEFDIESLLKVCSARAVYLLKKMCEPTEKKRFTIKNAALYIENPDFSWLPS